jgi:hypothetical protein
MIAFLVVRLVIQAADLLVARLIPAAGPGAYGALGGSAIVVLVWVPYFLRSRRVANTFLR